jgi:anti-sigma regulatory factor (Ser/Thr protein kinase)
MVIGCEQTMRRRRPAQAESVTLLRHAVVDFAARCGASGRQREDIALAVSEALSNAVLHAYVGRPVAGPIDVAATIEARVLTVVVGDAGIGMRARTDSPGLGLGMKLIGQLTDELLVTALHPGVRVEMTFAIG